MEPAGVKAAGDVDLLNQIAKGAFASLHKAGPPVPPAADSGAPAAGAGAPPPGAGSGAKGPKGTSH